MKYQYGDDIDPRKDWKSKENLANTNSNVLFRYYLVTSSFFEFAEKKTHIEVHFGENSLELISGNRNMANLLIARRKEK